MNRIKLTLAILLTLGSTHLTAQTVAEQAALITLTDEITGKIVYSSGGKVYTCALGETTPVQVPTPAGVTTNMTRWSWDGTRIVGMGWFSSARATKMYVMDADGGNFAELVTSVTGSYYIGFCGDFLPGDREVIYGVNGQFDAVNTATKAVRHVTAYNGNNDEVQVSRDGKWVTARSSSGSMVVDITTNTVHEFGGNCSPLVSPDGAMLCSNAAGHNSIPFRGFDGNTLFTLYAATVITPEDNWDNFHWSNHDDYICVQGDGGVLNDVYVLKLDRSGQSARGTRVTFNGVRSSYPDLWVAGQATAGQYGRNDKRGTGDAFRVVYAGRTVSVAAPAGTGPLRGGLYSLAGSLLIKTPADNGGSPAFDTAPLHRGVYVIRLHDGTRQFVHGITVGN